MRIASCWWSYTPSLPLYCPCSFSFFSCSTICLLQLRRVSCALCLRRSPPARCLGVTYYRLGKKRPCSGILSRYSRCAETDQAMPTMLTRTRPTTAVLPFQLAGCAYQPPAGDQTCLGHLWAVSGRARGRARHWRAVLTGSFLLRPL